MWLTNPVPKVSLLLVLVAPGDRKMKNLVNKVVDYTNNLQISEDIFESWAFTGSLCSCSCMISTSDNDLESSLVSTVTCCFQWKVTNTHQEKKNQLSGPSPYCEKRCNTSKRTSWPSWSSKRFDVVKTHIKPHLITLPPLPRLVFALRPVEAASSRLFLLFVSEVNILKNIEIKYEAAYKWCHVKRAYLYSW